MGSGDACNSQLPQYALVDCNNFFVSCERVFNPKLCDRPVIVLSNNDGCAVSRSNEAKALGIAMGEPYFKLRDLIREHNIAVLSSNFALYGDLSARVMSIISASMPNIAIYSIDEAFIDLTGLPNDIIFKMCLDLNAKIERYTGIPVSIGVGPTKTLAKVANHVAKKHNIPGRVYSLDSYQKTSAVLENFNIRDVWGIGRQLERRLHAMGVYTAAQLINLPAATIQQAFNIVLRRTIWELQGKSCIELNDFEENKQQIMVSRSFGERVTIIEHLQEALATYASMACEKLRSQNSVCGGIYVFLHTGLHGPIDTVYKNSLYIPLPSLSADTRNIIHYAKLGLQRLFRDGYRYQKVGIMLCDLADANNMQFDLFAERDIKATENLMQVIDTINHRLGRNTVQLAAAGLSKPWRMRGRRRSSGYVADWEELPVVRC